MTSVGKREPTASVRRASIALERGGDGGSPMTSHPQHRDVTVTAAKVNVVEARRNIVCVRSLKADSIVVDTVAITQDHPLAHLVSAQVHAPVRNVWRHTWWLPLLTAHAPKSAVARFRPLSSYLYTYFRCALCGVWCTCSGVCWAGDTDRPTVIRTAGHSAEGGWFHV